MISVLSKKKLIKQQKKRVMKYASSLLDKCATIPEVRDKIPELREVSADAFWDAGDMLQFEKTRQSLRGIMKYVQNAEERPNADQMAFLEKVVDYIVENGCIENVRDLMSASFDRPVKFSILFTPDEQKKLVTIINTIKDNALVA